MRPGDTIDGRYELIRLSSSGATGMVYEASDRRANRKVAVKLITPARQDPGLIPRIEREIKILSDLDHPNVVACYDSGQTEDEKLYLILEWLTGSDLSDYKKKHALSLRHALEVARQVADALAAAHAQEIIHRDIKPANIFLIKPRPTVMPDVRVLDFGVAKDQESNQALTFAGAILGTPCYMAPEQANYAMNVDGKADIFSLGVVLFELIVGRLPWASASDLARLARILIEPAKRIREINKEVPEAVCALVDAMLEHRPSERPEDIRQTYDRIVECLQVVPTIELDRSYNTDPELAEAAKENTASVQERELRESSRRRSMLRRTVPKGDVRTEAFVPPRAKRKKDKGDPTEVMAALRRKSARSRRAIKTEEDLEPIEMRTEAVEISNLRSALHADMEDEAPTTTPWTTPSITAESAHRAGPHAFRQTFDAPSTRSSSDPIKDQLSYVMPVKHAPFLGREKLMGHLSSRIEEATKKSIPARTIVVGPAGIGKTRVRAELSKLLRTGNSAPAVIAGRCEELARSSSYAFLRRMLLSEARIFHDDPPDVKESKLQTLLPEAGKGRGSGSEERTRFARVEEWTEHPSIVAAMEDAFDVEGAGERTGSDERASLTTYLAEALQLELNDLVPIWAARRDPRLMSLETRRALDIVLRELARPHGLVVLVDDAHFLDQLSASVLADLTRSSRKVPIAVIAFAQPTILDEHLRGKSPLLEDRPAIVEIDPLDPPTSRRLVAEITGGTVRSDALELLTQRAAGNPLYLEQLVRAVLDSEVLAKAPDGKFALTGLRGDASDVDRIPPTVAAAVRSRLSKLSPELREVLSSAAVFGEIFWTEGVADLIDRDLDETSFRLDQVLSKQFIRRRPRSRYQDATELEFSHSVIRSVVLSRKKRERRKHLERLALRYLEDVGETDEVTIARHTANIGDPEDAALLYAKAAGRALSCGAFDAALELADEGLRLTENDHNLTMTRAGLLDLVSRAAELKDDFEVADEALIELVDPTLPAEHRAETMERRALVSIKRRSLHAAAEYADQAESMWKKLSLPLGEATAKLARAEALFNLDDGRGALRCFLQAKPILEKHDSKLGVARCARGLARIALSSGDYANAERRYREALVQARAGYDAVGIFWTLLGLAEVYRLIGDAERAREYLDGAKKLIVMPVQKRAVRLQRALLIAEAGKIGKASRMLREIATRSRPPAGRAWTWRLATLYSAQIVLDYDGRAPLDRTTARGLARDVERALSRAVEEAPVLVLPLEASLSYLLAQVGELDRASAYGERVMDRFLGEGTVHEDESPRLLYAHAMTLERIGAATADVVEAIRRSVEQLDLVASRLGRSLRERYLARPMSQGILTAAVRSGLVVEQMPDSYRLVVR